MIQRVKPTPKALVPMCSNMLVAEVIIDYLPDGTVTRVQISGHGEAREFTISALDDPIPPSPEDALFDRLRIAVVNEFQPTTKR